MTLTARSQTRALDATAVLGRARFGPASQLRAWAAGRFGQLARGRAVPAAVSAECSFERGERVLSVGRDPAGGCALVATDRALYHRAHSQGAHDQGAHDQGALGQQADAGGWSRLGWERIAGIRWDAAAGNTAAGDLVIIGLAGLAPPRTVVPLHGRGTLLELAAERVTHTKLGRWHLLVAGTHRVLVEVRREPSTGELLWAVISGADGADGPDGPGDISGHLERAIARLGADFGVAPATGTGFPNGRLRSGDTAEEAG
jgi:hypothetical protein